MNILMIVLRVIHIFGGVFWLGISIFNVTYLQPAVQATGAEGQKVMQHLTRKTRLLNTTYGAASVNVLSGLIMYGIDSGFHPTFLATRYGLTLAIGGLSALVACAVAIFVIRNIFAQMGEIGRQIQAQGGPPTPAQGAAMQALGARLGSLGRVGLALLTITLLAMSIARYVG